MFYYSSNGLVFQSKVKALEYQIKTGNEICYYYFDHIYSKLDWTTEPSNTLDFYYREQAQRLREKYDYLILAYSGGYDSTNILETFHFNNIRLDKIVIVGAFGQDSGFGADENLNGELYKNAFPYIEKLGLTSITEKYDYTELFDNPANNLSVLSHGDDWVDHTGGWFSPHHWFWRDIEKHIIPQNIGSKKVGLIFGRDKPTLQHDSTFNFYDTPINCYGNIIGTDNCDRIAFYWDPEYPLILIKQLHVLNRLKNSGLKSSYSEYFGAQAFSGVDINQIIYNLKQPLIYKSPKSKTNIISLRDSYLYRKTNSNVYKYFADGIKNISSRVHVSNMKPIRTRNYKIQ